MTEEQIEKVINVSVTKAIERELGTYKVDKERHYQDHIFLYDLRQWYGDIRSSFWKSLITALVPGFLLLLFLGFIMWTGLRTTILGGK